MIMRLHSCSRDSEIPKTAVTQRGIDRAESEEFVNDTIDDKISYHTSCDPEELLDNDDRREIIWRRKYPYDSSIFY